MDQSTNLYIDLLKRCVSNYIYDDDVDLAKGQSAIEPATGRPVPADASSRDPRVSGFSTAAVTSELLSIRRATCVLPS